METTTINISSLKENYHFGSQSNYQKLNGSYFEKKDSVEENYTNKAIILSMDYDPDIFYSESDGYNGNCWLAKIIDSEEGFIYYRFRDFGDFVKFYDKKGYQFVKNNED